MQITLYFCWFCFFKKLLKNVMCMWYKLWSNCSLFLISTLNISYTLYLYLVKKPANVPTTYLANIFCSSSNKNNTHTLESFIWYSIFQIINWFLGWKSSRKYRVQHLFVSKGNSMHWCNFKIQYLYNLYTNTDKVTCGRRNSFSSIIHQNTIAKTLFTHFISLGR